MILLIMPEMLGVIWMTKKGICNNVSALYAKPEGGEAEARAGTGTGQARPYLNNLYDNNASLKPLQ